MEENVSKAEAPPPGDAGRGRVTSRRVITLAAGVSCVLGAVVSAGIAFALPPPTGSYPVGTTSITLRRAATARDPDGAFAVRLWYPSRTSAPRAPYGANAHSAGGWLYHLLVRTHAGLDARPLDGSYPILLYVAGWGGRNTDNTALIEELASHGYVVAALSDPAYDDPPPGDLSKPADLSSQTAFDDTVRRADAKIDYERRRASAVLDRLLAPRPASNANGTLVDEIVSHVDPHRAGIFGFSLGGAVALAACRRDARFKAAMNMDGWLFGAGREPAAPGDAPYLLVSDGAAPPSHAELSSSDPARRFSALLDASDAVAQVDNLSRGGYALDIAGADHLDYTDAALYAPLRRLKGGSEASRVAALTRSYAIAFFDTTLEGRRASLLAHEVHEPDFSLRRWASADTRESLRP